MKFLILFLVLIGSTFSYAFEGMTLVGTIGNKEFYYNSDLKNMNWMEARTLCTSSGLEFGEYLNHIEYSFIQQKVDQMDYLDLWVGGSMKDFENDSIHGAFSWTSGSPITNDVNFIKESKHWLCMYYMGDHTFTDFCTTGSHKALCQKRI